MPRERSCGFTLIESMVTLAVLVVLATLAVPGFAEFLEKSRLRGATGDLAGLLDGARIAAIRSQRNVNVSLGGSPDSWCAGANGAATPAPGQPVPPAARCDCTNAGACQVSGMRSKVDSSGYSGVRLSSVALSPTTADGSVTFDAKTGAVVPLTATATLDLISRSGKFSTRIAVSALGQSSVCVPAGKPPVPGYPPC